MTEVTRRTARVWCVDVSWRLLLLHWRDPHDGHLLWEPPGGGVETGETPRQAAARELREETGLATDTLDGPVAVDRDVWWNGRRHIGTESYFLARLGTDAPGLSRDGLLDYETQTLAGHRWIAWHDIESLTDPVEPPQWRTVLTALAPDGPWAGRNSP